MLYIYIDYVIFNQLYPPRIFMNDSNHIMSWRSKFLTLMFDMDTADDFTCVFSFQHVASPSLDDDSP